MSRNDPSAFLAAAEKALAERPSRVGKRRLALSLLGTRLAYARTARATGRPLAQVAPPSASPDKPN